MAASLVDLCVSLGQGFADAEKVGNLCAVSRIAVQLLRQCAIMLHGRGEVGDVEARVEAQR